MNIELTNEQKARIFAMYGYQTPVRSIDGDGYILTMYPKALKIVLHKIMPGQILHGISHNDDNGSLHRTYLNKDRAVKLILIPLSAISDKHAILIAELAGFIHFQLHNGKSFLKEFLSEKGLIFNTNPYRVINIYNQLILLKYAVPLFIEAGHPDNGKTAIDLGLAIEKK